MPAPRLVLLLLLASVLAGCAGGSGGSESRPDQDATLLLDGPPSAVDAGLYLATARGYDDAEGVHLQVRPPAGPRDAVTALAAGQADLAVLDIHDLAVARARGRDLVGVMAIVQTPLAAVLAQPGIRRPRDLEGRRAGQTGRAGLDAVLRAIVARDGGRPPRLRGVTVGLRAVPALLAGRVAAAPGFWSTDGVALKARRPSARAFRVDSYGAPAYPELVLAVSRETLQTKGPVVRATVRALRRGYEAAITDPDVAVTALTDAERALHRALASRQLDAVSPSFTAGARHFGELDPARLAAWAAWEQRFGIVARRPDVAAAFDPATSLTGLSGDPNA